MQRAEEAFFGGPSVAAAACALVLDIIPELARLKYGVHTEWVSSLSQMLEVNLKVSQGIIQVPTLYIMQPFSWVSSAYTSLLMGVYHFF